MMNTPDAERRGIYSVDPIKKSVQMDMLIFSISEPVTSVSLLMTIRVYSAPSAQSCFKVRPSVPIGFHSFHYLFATYLQESLTIFVSSNGFFHTTMLKRYSLHSRPKPWLSRSSKLYDKM